MDSSFRKLLVALAGLACAPADSQQQASKSLPIALDAETSSFDGQSNRVNFTGLRITQGDLSIEADEAVASGLDFEASEWRFTGRVRIVVDGATLEADSAVFAFKDHALATAELIGQPATFADQNPDRSEPARGTANKLNYDYANRTLRMSDQAWLNKGPNEIRGCDLIYDFDDERVTSGSSNCGPFRITVAPKDEGNDQDDAGAP
jgi:lipopolysaccharide transport protein LptA